MLKFYLLIGSLFLFLSCKESLSDNPVTRRADVDGLLTLADQLKLTDSDTALTMARSAYDFSKEYQYEQGMALSSAIMGKILYDIGGFSQAIKQLNRALLHFNKTEDLKNQASTQIQLAKVYQRSGNNTQAFLYLNKALENYEKLNDPKGLAEVFGELGHFYEKTQVYDSALTFQTRALEYYSQMGDTLGLATIHDNIGSIYEDLAVYDKAFEHFQMALLLNQSKSNSTAAVVNLNNIGDIYRKQNNLKNALIYTKKALDAAKSTNQDYQIKSANRDLSKIYTQLGDYEKAFEYLEESYELTDIIFSNEIAEEIAKTQAVYELEQKQQRIKFLEDQREKDRLLLILSVGGIVSFLFFSGFIFYQQRQKNHKERKLLETETELAKAELENTRLDELKLKTELENKQLREEQLKQELELKSKSLTKSALHMIQKNEFLQILRSKLKDLKKTDESSYQKKVKKLIKSIDLNFNLDDDWQEFEAVFQQVHSEFFIRLKEMYPNLTPSEVRLCAMIRLNLHSKDMAAIMGISQDSLRIARYRLRKRLGLEKGSNLYSYIINIG